MTYILTYNFDPNYLAIRKPYRKLHFAYITPYIEKGALLLGGATEDKPPLGILIFNGVSKDDIKTFANNDPYYKNNIVLSYSIVKWNAVAGSLMDKLN